MNYLISRKRSRALFGIGIVAISIGLISKKVINYPAGEIYNRYSRNNL